MGSDQGAASQKTVESGGVVGDTGRGGQTLRRPAGPAPPAPRRNGLKPTGLTRPSAPPSIPTSSGSPGRSPPGPTVNPRAPPRSPGATRPSGPAPRPSGPPPTGAKK